MTIDAESAVYTIHFVGLRSRQGCLPIQKASGNFGRRNRSIPCRELPLKGNFGRRKRSIPCWELPLKWSLWTMQSQQTMQGAASEVVTLISPKSSRPLPKETPVCQEPPGPPVSARSRSMAYLFVSSVPPALSSKATTCATPSMILMTWEGLSLIHI